MNALVEDESYTPPRILKCYLVSFAYVYVFVEDEFYLS